jgi:hypothetical protein
MPNTTIDSALEDVFNSMNGVHDLEAIVGQALRKAFDEVIDGPRTGRYDIEQLEKTEKTYIGTKVEIILRAELQLRRGKVLDNLIADHEVDTKFSLSSSWMIPKEAVGQLCLLIGGNDALGKFQLGLLRTSVGVLTAKGNQDSKKTVSAEGKKAIRWLVNSGSIPSNFLLDLPAAIRTEILSRSNGKQRLHTLFRLVQNQLIPRSAILQVAQLSGDPLKRAREAKQILAQEGVKVLCSTYKEEREEFIRLGFADVADGDYWLSVKNQQHVGSRV